MTRSHSGSRRGSAARELPGAADTVGAAARKALAVHTARLCEHVSGVRQGDDAEALHQVRVAVRQLRASLRLFGPGIPGRLHHALTRDLRWLAGRLGAVRDLDVQLERLAEYETRASSSAQAARKLFEAHLKAERKRRRAELLATLDSPRFRRLLLRLQRAALAAPQRSARVREPLASVALSTLEPAAKKLLKRGRKLEQRKTALSAERLHRLRSRVRRLRYSLGLLRNLTAKHGRQLVKRLSRLQDLFGAHQDAIVAVHLMQGYRDERRAHLSPSVVAGLDELIADQERVASAARDKLTKAWRNFAGKHARAEIHALLHRLRAQAQRATALQQPHQ